MLDERVECPRERDTGGDRERDTAQQARPDWDDDEGVGKTEGRQSDERDREAAQDDAAHSRLARRELERRRDCHTTTHVNLLRETHTIGSQVVVGLWVVGRLVVARRL